MRAQNEFDRCGKHPYNLSFQANATFNSNQDIPGIVSNAQQIVDANTAELRNLETTASSLVTRMDETHAAALNGRNTEQETFTNAERYLDIKQNFDERARGASPTPHCRKRPISHQMTLNFKWATSSCALFS